jgi:hypothetical protein
MASPVLLKLMAYFREAALSLFQLGLFQQLEELLVVNAQ